mgnify:CR=1 FL=1
MSPPFTLKNGQFKNTIEDTYVAPIINFLKTYYYNL